MTHQLSRHRAHRDACWQLDWSFDTLCTGGVDGTIKSFKVHVDSGVLTELISVDVFPLGVVSLLNLNGSLIAASSADGSVKIVDLKQARVVKSIRAGSTDCWSLAATNEHLVSGSAGGVINFWNVATGNHTNAVETGGSFVLSVVVFPDRFLATGHKDGAVRLFSLQGESFSSTSSLSLSGHAMPVRDLCFSTDGNLLYTACDDKTSQCFTTNGGEVIGTLRGHVSWVTSVSVSAKHVATGSADRCVKLWDSETRECLATFDVGIAGEVWAVAFSQDGLMLAAGTSSGDLFTYAVAVER